MIYFCNCATFQFPLTLDILLLLLQASGPSVDPKEYRKEELPEKSLRTFTDVHGCDESKAELQEIVEFLKEPARFTRLGAKLPKGVLLTGPPGRGLAGFVGFACE